MSVLLLSAPLLVGACFDEEPTEVNASDFYAVVLQPDAVNLAPGATQTLAYSVNNGQGAALTGAAAPTFLSTDTTKVTVTDAGVVTAVDTGTARVVARVTNRNVTRADTVVIRVSPSGAIAPAALTLSPNPVTLIPTCAVRVAAAATDANAAAIPGLSAPAFVSRNPSVAAVAANGTITGADLGSTYIVATLTSGGATVTDSVAVTVAGTPTVVEVTATSAGFDPVDATVVAGCLVRFTNEADIPIDITFTSTAPAPPGNVAAIDPGTRSTVRFLNAGTHTYVSDALRLANTADTTVVFGGSVTATPAP